MQKIFPSLWFNGNGKEACDFYSNVFENFKIKEDYNMVITFEIEGNDFMLINGGPTFKMNSSFSFFIMCETEAEIDDKWKKLSADGNVMMDLNKYPWSEKYGWCQDKYGVSWQLMMGKLGSSNQKIATAMMYTQDVAGRAEEAINLYTSLIPNSSIVFLDKYTSGPDEGKIQHGQFLLDNVLYVAMDSSMGHLFKFDEGVSLVLNCKDQAEIDFYWEKFLEDGGVASQCGWLKDKFGVSWQIVPGNIGELIYKAANPKAAVAAMMKMIKLDINTLAEAGK